MLLLAGDRKTVLDRPEEIDSASPRFGVDPACVLTRWRKPTGRNLDWVVPVANRPLRLYPAKLGFGTGRRGRSETFVEIDLDLLSGDDAGCLWLLLSVPALSEGGSVEEILRASEDYPDLGGRLRERVYREVMPSFARAVVAANVSGESDRGRSRTGLSRSASLSCRSYDPTSGDGVKSRAGFLSWRGLLPEPPTPPNPGLRQTPIPSH